MSTSVGDKLIQNTYDQAGRITSKSDENGTTTYTYDLLDRVLTETRDDLDDSRDYKLEYTYCPQGVKSKKLSVFNTESNSFEEKNYESFSYDNLNRLNSLSQRNTQAGNVLTTATYAYDSLNNLTEKIVNLGSSSVKQNFTYNNAGLTTKIEQYQKNASGSYDLGWSEDYTYKLDGNLTQKEDSLGNVTTYEYDSLGRLLEEQLISNDINRWKDTYFFDDYDNRSRKVHNNYTDGITTSTAYTYDKANRLLSEQIVEGTSVTDYDYQYDASGNLISKTRTLNGIESTILSNEYDDFNRLSKVVTPSKTSEYKYDANDQRITKLAGNQKTNHIWSGNNIVYDRITITEQPVAPDKSQLQQKIAEALAIDLTQYEQDGQAEFQSALSEAQRVNDSASSTQDDVTLALEALTTAITNLKEISSGANKTQLKSVINSAAGLDLTKYQEVGQADFLAALAEARRIDGKASATQAEVDAASNNLLFAMMMLRLKSTKSSRVAFELTNPEQMVTIDIERYQNEHVIDFTLYTVDSLKISILNCEYFQLEQEAAVTESEQQELVETFSSLLISNPEPKEQSYTFGADGLESMTLNGTAYSYTANARGDIVSLNSGTETVNQYQYDAYGNSKVKQQSAANPYQYSGQYVDEETGYYYLRARYYDPSIGRFTQEDTYHGTTVQPATLNLYNYCASNPVQNADPSGHWVETALDVASLGLSIYDMVNDPSWLNFGFLLWDIASLIPFVPGSYVGKGVKALGKVDDASDAYKVVKAAVKSLKLMDTLRDGARIIGRVANLVVDIVKKSSKVDNVVNAINEGLNSGKRGKQVGEFVKSAEQLAAEATQRIKEQQRLAKIKNDQIIAKVKSQVEAEAAARGKLVFTKGADLGANTGRAKGYNYSQSVIGKSDDLYHNFPKLLDDFVLENPNVSRADGRIEYLAHGSVNGSDGVYHITTRNNTIIHRTFIPTSDWRRFSKINELPSLDKIPQLK